MNLIEVFEDAEIKKQKDRFYGVTIAIVTNNEDPDKLGQVKVRFPWLSDENESTWARIAVLMAGNQRGTWFPPQIDDEVLVAFEHGDINRPIVIGALWNGHDVPSSPEVDKISIIDKGGSSLIFDSSTGNIEIEAKGEVIIKGKKIQLNP